MNEMEERFNMIFNATSDLVALIEVEKEDRFRLLALNPAATRITGRPRERVLGKEIRKFFTPEEYARILEQYHKSIRGKEHVAWEDSFESQYGKLTFEAVVSPVFDSGGNCSHLLAVCRDVTAKRRTVASLVALAAKNAQLFEEAQRALKLRDDFLSIASHEFKTPLTSLALNIQMLGKAIRGGGSDAATSKKVSKMLDSLAQQADSLVRLVEDLFDVTRIAAGQLTYHFEKTDLVELIKKVLSIYEEQLKAVGCSVTLAAAGSARCDCDRTKIEEVVTNLVTNAIKYAAGSGIEVSVFAGPGRVGFSVKDHGIGIDFEHQSRIFERFERAVSPHSYGGLGLGLYISSEIVKAHRGPIRVESEPGDGAMFVVELPESQPETAIPADAEDGSRQNIQSSETRHAG